MAHTAKEVRALANKMLDWSSVDDEAYADEQSAHAMLKEYADRLEQDETPRFKVIGPCIVTGQFPDLTVDCSKAAEEGRREVYREIAAIDPRAYAPGGDECPFCERLNGHEETCLWIRATAALRETTPTP